MPLRFLVSDDGYTDGEGIMHPNTGITLPDRKEATHNIELSPLFFARTGRVYHWINGYVFVSSYRGSSGFFWAANEMQSNAYLLWVIVNNGSISPSHLAGRAWAWSLRCLVSTNNG